MRSPGSNSRSALPENYSLQWYRIENVLGQGAFGITYRAEDINLGRSVAIKEFLPRPIAARDTEQYVAPTSNDRLGEFATGLANFISEARTLAKFEHPNIVHVYNVFEANGTAYMVMQYEEGDTLSNILRLQGTLTEEEISDLVFPLLSGLETVHAAGFIHRDIKPSNIFIREEDGSPVLLDFGSARLALQSNTRELTNLVTGGYAPIEQYTGRGDKQGPWTDVYGLGATLYRAVTAQAPVDAIERGESLATDASDPFIPCTTRAAGRYPRELLEAIDLALRFRIEDRPQTVAQWRNEFEMTSFTDEVDIATAEVVLVSEEEDTLETETVEIDTFRHFGNTLPGLDATPVSSNRQLAAALAFAFVSLSLMYFSGADFTGSTSTDTATIEHTVVPQEPAEPPTNQATATNTSSAAARTPEAEVAELLATAEQDMAAFRLTTPYDSNAYDKYRKVLELDPSNEKASEGLDAIANRYVKLSYRDMDSGNFPRAKRYLLKAQQISPNSDRLLSAQQTLLSRQRDYRESGSVASRLLVNNAKSDGSETRANSFLKQIGSGAGP